MLAGLSGLSSAGPHPRSSGFGKKSSRNRAALIYRGLRKLRSVVDWQTRISSVLDFLTRCQLLRTNPHGGTNRDLANRDDPTRTDADNDCSLAYSDFAAMRIYWAHSDR